MNEAEPTTPSSEKHNSIVRSDTSPEKNKKKKKKKKRPTNLIPNRVTEGYQSREVIPGTQLILYLALLSTLHRHFILLVFFFDLACFVTIKAHLAADEEGKTRPIVKLSN